MGEQALAQFTFGNIGHNRQDSVADLFGYDGNVVAPVHYNNYDFLTRHSQKG